MFNFFFYYFGEKCETSLLNGGCVPGVCSPPSECAPLIKGGFICENCTQSPFYNDFCELEARSFSNGAFLALDSLQQRFKFNIRLEFASIVSSGQFFFNYFNRVRMIIILLILVLKYLANRSPLECRSYEVL